MPGLFYTLPLYKSCPVTSGQALNNMPHAVAASLRAPNEKQTGKAAFFRLFCIHAAPRRSETRRCYECCQVSFEIFVLHGLFSWCDLMTFPLQEPRRSFDGDDLLSAHVRKEDSA